MMKRGMRGTLSGWNGNLCIPIEVSAKTLDRFNQIKRRLGLQEAQLMGRIVTHVPHNHHLDENHVIWYLDMLEQSEVAKREAVGKGSEKIV